MRLLLVVPDILNLTPEQRKKRGKNPLSGPLGPKGHLTPETFLELFNGKLKEDEFEKPYYEGISLHPYVFKTRKPVKKAGEFPERAHAPENEADAKHVRDEIKAMISGLQDQAEEELGARKPIWVTELGFPVRAELEGKPDPTHPPVTVQEQALLVQATFSMLERSQTSLKVAHAIYYNIRDIPGEQWDQHSGLLTNTGFPRPAWETFRKLAGGLACTVGPC